MKYFIEMPHGEVEVELVDLGDNRYTLRLGDREIQADFHAVDAHGQYACLLDGRSYAASIAEQDSQTLDVTIGGETFFLKAQDERERTAGELASARPVAEVIKASMPGIVVSLTVAVGDVLEDGQSIGILEAMKMQNEVTAPHGGVVAEVGVETGQAVDSGQVLVRLEPGAEA